MLLNMGFRDDIEFILGQTPSRASDRSLFSHHSPGHRGNFHQHTQNLRADSHRGQALTVPSIERVYAAGWTGAGNSKP